MKLVAMGHAAQLIQRFALVGAFALVAIFFCIWPETGEAYRSNANIVTTIGNNTVVALIAIAIVIPLSAGVLDLSVGATAGLASIVVAAGVARYGLPVPMAIILAIAASALIGLVNGMLLSRYQLNPIILTLAVGLLLGGALKWYAGGTQISGSLPLGAKEFGRLNWFGLPRLLFVLLPVMLIAWYLSEHTPFGRGLAAIGSNKRAAALVGIRVNRSLAMSLVLSGAISGVAGSLLTLRSTLADADTGPSFLFPALAAVFLGATVIKPGMPNVLGAFIGTFFVAFTVSGFLLKSRGHGGHRRTRREPQNDARVVLFVEGLLKQGHGFLTPEGLSARHEVQLAFSLRPCQDFIISRAKLGGMGRQAHCGPCRRNQHFHRLPPDRRASRALLSVRVAGPVERPGAVHFGQIVQCVGQWLRKARDSAASRSAHA